MGLLQDPAPTPTDEEEADTSVQIFTHASEHRNNFHEVIGDALEVFSRHLRAHN